WRGAFRRSTTTLGCCTTACAGGRTRSAAALFARRAGWRRLLRRRSVGAGGVVGRSTRAGCRWRRRRTDPHVAGGARVRAAWPQALDHVDDERQRLEFDVDPLDRLGRGELVYGRQCENRFALIQRLVGEAALRD